jgi:hypothetical protein
MPGAAAGLADVGTGDPQPLVLGRSGQHPLQQLTIARLELGPILELTAGDADPGRERVADRLQLAQAERPRLICESTDSGVDREARKGLGDQGAKLRFEAADLTPQLDPGEPLVAIYAKRSAPVSVEQIRHSPKRV